MKIETDLLRYFRLNQQQLGSNEYSHLRKATNTDGKGNNVEKMTILTVTYFETLRHMHEYAQDAMSYVRQYGCQGF